MSVGKIAVFFLIAVLLLTGVYELIAGNNSANSAKNDNLFSKMEIFDARNGKIISEKEFLAEISKNNVVYILEEHDNSVHHLLQTKIAEFLGKNNKNFAIGFEMFDKNTGDQKYLDLYQRGEINEEEFIKRAWHWKIPDIIDSYALYKNILDLIGVNHYKGIALNIPMPITQMISQKISRDGFDSLPEKAKLLFPKDGFKISCDCPDGQYHNAIMKGLEAMRGMNIPMIEKRFHTSQWVMNEVMAASILDYFEKKDLNQTKMVVAVGNLHGIYNEGILASARNRNPELKQITVFALNYSDIERNIPKEKFADFIFLYK